MPIIRIHSLTRRDDFQNDKVLSEICNDLSLASDIETRHFTITWQYIETAHYLHQGTVYQHQSSTAPPLLAEILLPDFHAQSTTNTLVKTLANSLSEYCEIEIANIFIEVRQAKSGTVYDSGDFQHW